MTASKRLVVALALALSLPLAVSAAESLEITRLNFHDLDALARTAKGRPNEEARLAGLKSYLRGDHEAAAEQFRIGAHYADKFSQHALSLMYWHGIGVPRDHIQAYIWADLAAERMSKSMLLVREKMWGELSPAEQQEAVDRGQDFYAKYGDSVAQPRTESQLRLVSVKMTGSHIGFDRARIGISGRPDGGTFAPQKGSSASAYVNASAPSADELYREGRRDYAGYWRDQDNQLNASVRAGGLENVQTKPGG